jgi:hypothetical protein
MKKQPPPRFYRDRFELLVSTMPKDAVTLTINASLARGLLAEIKE